MKRIIAIALAVSGALAGGASADPGGTSSVSSPSITQGQTSFELRGARFGGGGPDGDMHWRAIAGHGVTDWWRPSVVLRVVDPDDASAELRSVALSNTFDFTPSRTWPVRFGAVVEYKAGLDGRDDSVELKLLSERRAGRFRLNLNLDTERDVYGPREWEIGYATRAQWRVGDHWSVGAEAFGTFDVDEYVAGPRVAYDAGPWAVSASYLIGYDAAEADNQLRFTLSATP